MKKVLVWIGSIVAAVLTAVLTNWLTPLPVFGFIRVVVVTCWRFVTNPVALPLWALIVIAFAYPVLVNCVRCIASLFRSDANVDARPLFEKYTTDHFLDVEWHWSYANRKINDDTITARCPHCKCLLDWRRLSGWDIVDCITLVCPECGFQKAFEQNEPQLVRLIHQKIDRKLVTKEYRDVIQEPAG